MPVPLTFLKTLQLPRKPSCDLVESGADCPLPRIILQMRRSRFLLTLLALGIGLMVWNLEWLQSFRYRDCASQSSFKAAEMDYDEPWDTDCLQSVLYIIAKDWPEVAEKMDFTKPPSKRNFTNAYSPDESVEELQLATIQVGTRKHEFFFHAINSLAHYLKRPVTYYVIVDDASLGYMEPLRKAFSHPLIKLVYIHKNTTKFDLSIDAFRGGGTGTFYKLFAQQIFPHHSKIIFADHDILWLRDPYDLWYEMQNLPTNKLLGMCFEMSANYEHHFAGYRWDMKTTPYLRRWAAGINAGIELFNLDLMREWDWVNKWNNTWRNRTTERAILGDQDIFNLMLKTYPDIFHVIHPGWDVQSGTKVQQWVSDDEMYALHSSYKEGKWLVLHRLFWAEGYRFLSPRCHHTLTRLRGYAHDIAKILYAIPFLTEAEKAKYYASNPKT